MPPVDDKDLIYEGIATESPSPIPITSHRRQRPDLRRDCDLFALAHPSAVPCDDKDLIYEGIATFPRFFHFLSLRLTTKT